MAAEKNSDMVVDISKTGYPLFRPSLQACEHANSRRRWTLKIINQKINKAEQMKERIFLNKRDTIYKK